MLEGFFMLLILSTIMAVASFLTGSLPLSFALSPSRLRLVATIGMGVLVGTALIVIIPEGVETLYSASDYTAESHARRDLGTRTIDVRSPAWHQVDPRGEKSDPPRLTLKPEEEVSNPWETIESSGVPSKADFKADAALDPPPLTPTEVGKIGIMNGGHHSKASESISDSISSGKEELGAEKAQPRREPHAWIGLSLVLGFILMYLLDKLPLLAPSSVGQHQNNIYSLSDLSSSPGPSPSAPPQRSLSTTLGLCIHAAADGIALGASSASSSTTSLSLIIFVAIMVHKAPAAFGLTSVLLKQGLSKRVARTHLTIFSLAAPVGAFFTWIVVRALGAGESGEPALMKWWTGVLLLFSGGTFLYVAMHTMQEDESQTGMAEEMQGNGYLDGPSGRGVRRQKEGQNPRLVLAAVGGMLLPLLTQIGHAH